MIHLLNGANIQMKTNSAIAATNRVLAHTNRQSATVLPRVIEVTFHVQEDTLPALYSAIEEISNEVGSRLEAPHSYPRQDALTRAARALGELRKGISKAHRALSAIHPRDRRFQSPFGDADYR